MRLTIIGNAPTRMSNVVYKRAPVSEVILGHSYSGLRFPLSILFRLQGILEAEYPIIEIVPPLVDEEPKGGVMAQQVDPNRSGLFMIRLRSEDHKWLVQLQGNKVYLNWSRKDSEEVGQYPGLTAIRKRFKELLSEIEGCTGAQHDVATFDLSYHDRIKWSDIIPSLDQLDKIVNGVSLKSGMGGVHQIDFKEVFSEKKIGGYGIVSLTTGVHLATQETDLLQFQCILRGMLPGMDMDQWIEVARKFQMDIFERTFTKAVLKSWK